MTKTVLLDETHINARPAVPGGRRGAFAHHPAPPQRWVVRAIVDQCGDLHGEFLAEGADPCVGIDASVTCAGRWVD